MKRWPLFAIVLVWLLAVSRLVVTDVWDETIGLSLHLRDQPYAVSEVFAQKIPVFSTRPFPLLLQNSVARLTADFHTALILLRGLNAALLLASLGFLLAIVRRGDGAKPWHEFVVALAVLFSASGFITAGWAANVFDASCLLFISAGLYFLLARKFSVAAGFLFSLSLFSKEIGLLAFPFVVLLAWQEKITVRQLFATLAAAAPLLIAYIFFRLRITPPGSAKDVHGFALSALAPSLAGWFESFWRQNLMRDHGGTTGWLWLAASLIFLRDRKAQIGAIGLLLFSGLMYWGMTDGYQHGLVMSPANFIPRLYLLPAALFVLLFALQKRFVLLAVLLIAILPGGIATYRNHLRFQKAYLEVQRMAEHRGAKRQFAAYDSAISLPLYDAHRDIYYGKLKNSDVVIVPENGKVDRIKNQ